MKQWPFHLLILLMIATPLRLAQADDRPPRIWILPFQQLEEDSSLAYLEDGLPALLAVAVSRSDSNALVERQQVDRLLAEQSLTLEGLTSPDSRHRIGMLLGATVMITGTFVRQDQDILITMRASDLASGIITAAGEARGPARQPGKLVGQLYRQLAGALVRRLPDLAEDQIDEAPLANLHFMKGLGHYHSARYSPALAEFMLAAEDEQLSDTARLWLAKTYMAERQHVHAYLELTRLTHGGSSRVRDEEVAALLRASEEYLSAEDVKIIRELAAHQVRAGKSEFSGGLTLVTSRSDLREPYRFFGGRTVTLPLLIHTSDPDGLDVRAELVQLTSSLAVRVTDQLDVPLAGGDFSLTVPAVNRETDFELRFRSRKRGEETWQAAGRIAIRAYPADLLSPVRAWAESHPLRVEDDRGSVIRFLLSQKIPIADRSSVRGVTMYAGPRALQKHASLPLGDGETVVLFTERETDIPHLLVDRTGRGTIMRVETKLLDRLDTDPQAQKLLLEIFLHLDEQVRMEGVDR